jgi:hypothetical protein
LIHTINILGREYRIEYVSAATLDGSHGDHDGDEGLIRVNQTSQIAKKEIILHEVLHAILHEAGIGFILKSKLEEAIVRALENGLIRAGLIRDLDSSQV